MMIDFSWSHILLLLAVALVVVGPKDLPRMMRIAGQWMGKARAMADQFRRSFDDMARQSELDELRKELDNLRAEKPLAGLHEDLSQPIVPPLMRSLQPAAAAVPAAAVPAAAVPAAAVPVEVETAPDLPGAAGDFHPPAHS